MAAAEAFQKLPAVDSKEPFNFVFVSGEGATHTPGRLTPIFGRVKGETELLLAEMRKKNSSFHASTIRPAGVDDSQHASIAQYVPARPWASKLAAATLLPVVRMTAKSFLSPTEALGPAMVEMAMGKWDNKMQGKDVIRVGESPIVSNVAFRRIFGLR